MSCSPDLNLEIFASLNGAKLGLKQVRKNNKINESHAAFSEFRCFSEKQSKMLKVKIGVLSWCHQRGFSLS